MILREDIKTENKGNVGYELSKEVNLFKNYVSNLNKNDPEKSAEINLAVDYLLRNLQLKGANGKLEHTQNVERPINKAVLNVIPHLVICASEDMTREQILTGRLDRDQVYKRVEGKDTHSIVVSSLIHSALRAGASVNDSKAGDIFRNILGNTSESATSYSIGKNNYNALKTIVHEGGNLNSKIDPNVPLHRIFDNYDDYKQVIRGVCREAELGVVGKPQASAKGMALLKEYMELNRKLIQKLVIENTKDINIETRDGRNAMHKMAQSGKVDKEVFVLLVNKGIDLNKKDINRNTPLHTAANYGNIELLEIMRDMTKGRIREFHGKLSINPNTQNKDGQAPLHLAALSGECMCFEILVKIGANPNVKDNRGKFPFYYFDHDKSLLKEKAVLTPQEEKRKKEMVVEYLRDNGGKYPNGFQNYDKIGELQDLKREHINELRSRN